MVRPQSAEAARELGAEPVVADPLDREQVIRAVNQARPEAILHELTALPHSLDMRHIDREFEMTNRLRTEGTDNLLAAGREAGVEKFIAQSYGGWPSERSGGPVKTEDDPLDPDPPKQLSGVLAAIRHLEEAVTGAEWTTGIVLRYGALVGPGTSLSAEGGAQIDLLRERKYPVVGDGGGVWSFVHVEDAAEATVAAVEHGVRGVYNVVDDYPAPVAEWLPEIADAIGAKPPRHVPRWLGRMVAGEAAAVMMTEVRGSSNEKAKRVLNWRPRRSWRSEFGVSSNGGSGTGRVAEVGT
jgi:nucleoside-diphosphate-sugar epimerase